MDNLWEIHSRAEQKRSIKKFTILLVEIERFEPQPSASETVEKIQSQIQTSNLILRRFIT